MLVLGSEAAAVAFKDRGAALGSLPRLYSLYLEPCLFNSFNYLLGLRVREGEKQ